MASISIKTYVKILLSSLHEVNSDEVSDRIKLFISMVRKNKDEKKLHEIERVFEREFYKAQGIEKGFVNSSFKLTEKEMKAIEEMLEKKLKTRVEVKNEIDKSLIGGFKFFSENHVLDASIGKKIADLEKKLSA